VATVTLALGLGFGLAATIPSYAASQSDRAEAALAEQLDASHVPGGALSVVTNQGTDSAGVGDAGDAEATAATPFVIGSTTKSFTALAVMQLVDAGEVDLDAPVRDYVPELSLARGEAVDSITVRHVLQQTSGLDDLSGGALLASAADGTPLQAVAELQEAELKSSPGKTWRYANINYVLAGLVVERASGMTYANYIAQRIFDPLGMTHSTARGAPPDVSAGHQFWFGVPVASGPVVRRAVMAAGYLISTAEDLGRYLAMYLAEGRAEDGTRLVSAAGLRTLLTPGPEAQLGPWADAMSSRYAMGWFVGGPWAADAVFHPGNSPDSSAMLALFPDQDMGVATMVNAGHELPVPGNPALTDRMARNVMHAALGEAVPATPSLGKLYGVFDLVSLLLLGLAAVGSARAISASRHGQPPARPALTLVGIVLRTVGVVALLVVPVLLSGWTSVWTWSPDLVVVLGCLVTLLTITAALRSTQLVRQRAQRAGPPPPPRVPARSFAGPSRHDVDTE
jgi:CubicO group peptidase (beta-lactamase class C family)